MNNAKPNYSTLTDIVKVKNAVLIFDYTKNVYALFHYDTQIAEITKDNKINFALKCSVTSSKAIYQLTDYLGIDRKDVKLKPFYNFVKAKNNNLGIDQ
jgi:hypothetical protein